MGSGQGRAALAYLTQQMGGEGRGEGGTTWADRQCDKEQADTRTAKAATSSSERVHSTDTASLPLLGAGVQLIPPLNHLQLSLHAPTHGHDYTYRHTDIHTCVYKVVAENVPSMFVKILHWHGMALP